MATLTVQINTGSTVSKTLTFSAPDAQRIMTAFQNVVQPGATTADVVNWAADMLKGQLRRIVVQSETSKPSPPVMT